MAFTAVLWSLCTQAFGASNVLAEFKSKGPALILSTFHEPKEPPPNKVGIIGIIDGARRNSFVFGLDQVQELLELWTKALAIASENEELAGTILETGTEDDLHLVLLGGRDITFVLASRQNGALKASLTRADAARFEEAMQRIKTFLQSN